MQTPNVRSLLSLTFLFLIVPAMLPAQTAENWERVDHRTEFTLWDVSFADSLHGSIVGDYGVIMRSTDGGRSWTQRLSSDQFAFRNIYYINDSIAVASGFRGTFHRSTDAGATWTRIPLPDEKTYPGMSVVGNTVWLSGENGNVLKSTDQGRTWVRLASGIEDMIGNIAFADANNGWCASVQRDLLHSSDGGATWNKQEIDSFFPVSTLYARSAQECWLAGRHGLLMRTTDAGRSWQRIPAYDTDYFDLKFDAKGRGWAVGKRGAIVRGQQDNSSWKLHDLTPAKALHAITFLPNNQAVAVGENGAVYRLDEVYPTSPAAPGTE
jgi:photosystem II stability/assembly factor-like uncharacterized protein